MANEHEGPERERAWLAGLLHDLNNPLAVVSSSLDLVREQLRGLTLPRVAAEALLEASDATGRLRSLMDDVALLLRLERATYAPQREPLDLQPLLTELARDARGLAAERNIAVVERFEGVPPVTTDRTLVGRIVANVLEACLRHTPSDGRVELGLMGTARGAQIQIAHTGPSIPSADRPGIFDKMGTRASGRGRVHTVPGAGLHFCKLAATALGGDIELVERPDWPTVFVVHLGTA